MPMTTLARKPAADSGNSPDAATWLGLAASPTFALMAWMPAGDMQAMAGASGPFGLSIGGMPFMYLLMGLFHLPPWLKLAAAIARRPTPSTTQNGD